MSKEYVSEWVCSVRDVRATPFYLLLFTYAAGHRLQSRWHRSSHQDLARRAGHPQGHLGGITRPGLPQVSSTPYTRAQRDHERRLPARCTTVIDAQRPPPPLRPPSLGTDSRMTHVLIWQSELHGTLRGRTGRRGDLLAARASQRPQLASGRGGGAGSRRVRALRHPCQQQDARA